jgi:deoxyribonuclease-4
MLYTGAPQNTKRRPVSELHVTEAQALMQANDMPMDRMIVHAPYIINLANSVKPEVAELAEEFLQKELERTHEIGAKYLVLHPGSYTTTDPQTGIRTIIANLNRIKNYPEGVIICLETMAGKGSEVGRTFEEMEAILAGLDHPEHFGVCLDTCHIWDGGYDVADFDHVLDEFDHVIGLQQIHVVHLNDSKNGKGSHKDRHANIGTGEIGFDILHSVAENARLADVVKILETPYISKKPPYQKEIAMLRSGKYDPDWTKEFEEE